MRMISIIIPAHNEKKNLEKLLPHIENHKTTIPYEILVAVSPNTTDSTNSILHSKKVLLLKSPKKGRAAQMNYAAKHAKGTILVFLHADVFPPKSFLSDIQLALSKNIDAGFFSYKFDSDNFFLKINASFTSKDGVFTGGGDQCLFIKTKKFNTLKGFNEEQIIMEDFEFFKRIKKNKIPYTIINNNLIVSARKYEHNSYLRVNLSNLILVVLFKFGCSPKKLKKIHSKLIKTQYHNG